MLVFLVFFLLQSQRVRVNPDTRMKAVFLINFTKYISWTSLDTAQVFNIGVYGLDEILMPLRQMAKERRAMGQQINVARVGTVEEVEACQILFVPLNQVEKFREMKPDIPPENILVVGESLGFATSDGAINFIKRDGKIKLEINRKALADANLVASSHLLKLAILVGEEEILYDD